MVHTLLIHSFNEQLFVGLLIYVVIVLGIQRLIRFDLHSQRNQNKIHKLLHNKYFIDIIGTLRIL